MTILRSEIFPPSDLPDVPSQYSFPASGRMPAHVSVMKIADAIERTARQMQLPLDTDVDMLKPDGLFGFKKPCILALHPNPPREYYRVLIEPQKASRRDRYAPVAYWFCGSSSTLDVLPGVRMESMHARIIDEASLKRAEDWTIVPELDYYQHLFDVLRRALSSLDRS